MAYATIEELDAILGVPTAMQDSAYGMDEALTNVKMGALDAGAEQIDEICDRSFAVAEATASDRVFVTYNKYTRRNAQVLTDDFVEVPTVVMDGDSEVPSERWGVVKLPTTRRPGRHLVFSRYRFEHGTATVTARWGWPAVPPAIKQANLLLSSRLFMRQLRPLGVVTSGDDYGQFMYIPRRDYALMDLLEPYMRARIR